VNLETGSDCEVRGRVGRKIMKKQWELGYLKVISHDSEAGIKV